MELYARSAVEPRYHARHIPKLCRKCGRPMSVREKRAGDVCFKCQQLADLEALWRYAEYYPYRRTN